MDLKTKRLRITEITLEMIPSFMSYHNDMKWMMYQGLKGLTEQEYQGRLLNTTDWFEGKQLAVLENEQKKLIGDIYLKFNSLNSCTIGYTIHPDYARKGFTKEALLGLFDWLKDQDVKEIHAFVLKDNNPSIKLLERLSFILISEEDEEKEYKLTF